MILVTGASGFLGSHLVAALQQEGAAIRAVYNSTPPPQRLLHASTEWVQADLLDIYDVERIMQGVKQIYHCAAIVSYNPKEREQMLHFNPESTANLINAALEAGVDKVVYASSIAALGSNKTGAVINEDAQWEESTFNSAYGISKYLAEMEVWRGIGEGLEAAIVNPGVILGPGDWSKGSAALMNLAWKEFPFYTKGITAWVDVNDVAQCMMQLMQSDISSERFILSEGNRAYRDIFTLMAEALDKKPPKYFASPLLSALVWRCGKVLEWMGKKSIITKETAQSAQSVNLYDNSKILSFLPEFKYTPIEQTIKKMASQYITDIQ